MSDVIDNVATIVSAARDGVDITHRMHSKAHPDNENVTVPVVLDYDVTGREHIRLAKDVLAELDSRMPGPRRREGRVQLLEVASFCEYVARYQTPASVVYANPQAMTFEAVIDEHPTVDLNVPSTPAAWRGHRATYTCPRSPEWIAWTAQDGRPMKQEAFADFLEARLEDMTTSDGMPKPLEMLDVARKLHIRTKGEFRREINPTNGDHILINKTETTAESTQIPRAFALAIPVFEGGERYRIEARVRFALSDHGPAFSYTLHRRQEIERDAFGEVRKVIAATTKLPVLSGTP